MVLAATTGAANLARAQDTDACINASEKAVALRKADKLVEQRAALSMCAASSCPDAVRTSCQQRLAQANQAIPSIVFLARDGGGRDLVAVKLTVDGAAYAERLDGSAIALDPGEHEFRFEVLDQPPVVKRFVMHQGEQNRRETVVLGPAPVSTDAAVPSASAGAGIAPEASPPAEASANPSAHRRAGPQRALGVVIGAVGVASLSAGAVFGGLSLAAHNSYSKNCGSSIGAPSGFCNSQGVSGEGDAATKGTLSTIFFIAGGVATVAGGALFFTSPRAAGSPQVGVGMGSLVVKGRF